MKAAAIYLACTLTVALGRNINLNVNGCPEDYTVEQLYPHEECHKFYQCFHGDLVVHKCAANLYFSIEKQQCDFASTVNCGDRIIPTPDQGDGNKPGEDSGNDGNTNCNCNPKEAPSICAKDGSEGILIAHENCNKFYKCGHGLPVTQRCPGNLLYNPYKEYCDWPQNVECGDRVISAPEEGGDDGGNDNESEGEDSGNGGNDCDGGTGNCNCDPSEAPTICAKDGSDGTLIAHENCNKFYKCAHGKPVTQLCPGNLLYNPYKEYCDWPQNVECGDRVISVPEEGGDDGGNDNESEDEDSGNGGNDCDGGTGNCNCDPSEAPTICAKDGSEGTLIAHENCNKFYKCAHGLPVTQRCPGNLLYNPYKEYCDWPQNVECGDRVISVPEEGGDEGGNDNESEGEDSGNGGNDCDGGPGTCNCDPSEAPTICAKDGSDGTLIAHENCNKFYKCAHGKPVTQLCPGNLLYNPYKEYCDWPQNVECGDRVISVPEEGGDDGGNDNESEGEDSGNGGNDCDGGPGTCNCDPSEAPTICAKDGSDGTLIAHENCNKFYECAHGLPVTQRCPENLLYNPYKGYCDWPQNVECGDRVIPAPEEGGDDGGNENENEDEDSGNGGNDCDGGPGTCNCDPSEAPTICAKDGSDGTLIAHEHCNKFYKCAHGLPVAQRCPGNLLYNPYKEYCDWPQNVECGDRVIPAPEEDCDDGENDNENEDEDSGNGGNDGEGGPGTCNCDPSEAPTICAKDGSDGTLIAHENCNKFYKCAHGLPVTQRCPGNLLYNPYKEYCDWPQNVECGDRVIPAPEEGGDDGGNENESEDEDSGNGGNDGEGGPGTCNCDPSEAPTICAKDGSDGTLIAHENCNKFYKCVHGLPVAQRCPGNLLYNPYKEYCDWPQNVECGDRVIPAPEEGGDDGGNENESEDEDSGNGGNDGEGGPGTCNCDPSEAPTICAKDGSDGTLIAHENCNKFYKCAHGLPVAQRCPGNLLYNPYKEYCDWPQNVECGDRVISAPEEGADDGGNDNESEGEDSGNGGNDCDGGPGTCNCDPSEAPTICAKDGSDGTLIAHENCNKFYECAHGLPVTQRCPGNLLYNPYKEYCDWPQNVECGDRVIPAPEEEGDDGGNENEDEDSGNGGNDGEGGPGTCNCDPSEAPTICAKDGSDGTLIAHENCNKFYECAHGLPVTQRCPGNLLYNPYKEYCDWPQNVECGDRVISAPEEGADDGGNDNESEGEDSGNGGNDCDGGPGTCNCDPSEAPTICAKDGSDGTLIAHENCNKFYKCAHGLPVTQRCPGNLLYNPYKEYCDWPQNVECGDRVIPAPEEDCDDGENDNENEDEDSGNGGNDGEGGPGTCNCDPSEAPTICAKDGSDGTLIAHENCNKFYKCAHGLPVAQRCPGNLLYNPYKEYCDWPQNVECGDRVLPEPEDESDDNNAENEGDGGNGDSSDSNNIDYDPEEAPAKCAKNDSEGYLLVHKFCNKFYKCSYGQPIPFSCPSNLMYSASKKICDFPENVKCGNRIVIKS